MKYEPKTLPEGINTSDEHPLKELAVLLAGALLLVAVTVGILAYSADMLVQFIPVDTEQQLFSDRIHFADTKVNDDSRIIDNYLQQLVNRLQSNVDKDRYPDYRFTISVYPSDIANAFAYPGGHIGISSALFDKVTSENGLAMVIAHEMAHHYYRHPLRAMGRGVVIALALLVITGTDSSLADTVLTQFTTAGVLAFNREQERNADHLGLQMLRQSYGHTAGASEFFRAMQSQDDDSRLGSYFSTHPGTQERIAYLEQDTQGTPQQGGTTQKTELPETIRRLAAKLQQGDKP